MEEMPIKYVKDKDGKFLPITSPNAVINEDGKNINELYVSYESGVEIEPQINELLEKIYPIGSIYMSINSTSPASFLGGTWEQLPEGYALWTASSGAGSTINAGLPNITGNISKTTAQPVSNGTIGNEYSISGALYGVNGSTDSYYQTVNGTFQRWKELHFDASRSNNIYGASTTVQPPAYKVYAWVRVA